jgi:cytochrome c-type biogenesis protein CcmF
MAEIGRLAVWVALLAGGMAVVSRRRLPLTVAVGAALLATLVLARALVGNDFSLVYVADFSRRDASAPFRLAALWGGMAGSLLWFATLAGAAGWWAAGRVRSPGSDSAASGSAAGVVAAVTGGLVAALAGLVLAFADPFRRLEVPAVDGGGLTPILEHPAMLYHPPLLYLGLASLTGPFALTVAGLLGRAPEGWAATVRRWLVVPWTLLAAGMLAGAHWAYVELGWGGYWAWDPVENTALLPWLAVTLALHAGVPRTAGSSGSRSAPRSPLPQAALVGLAFLLALTGTMLTRSGAVSSVHAFAESRAIGRALGALVVAATVGVVALLGRAGRAAPAPAAGPPDRGLLRRLLAGHFLVVGTVLGVATIGTLAPLVTDLRGGDGIAIEGRYFASFAGPLAAAGLALVALVPLALGVAARRSALLAAGGGLVAGVGLLYGAGGDVDVPVAVLAGVAGAATLGAIVGGLAARSGAGRGVTGHVAHAGLGLLLLGVAGTASGATEMVPVVPGDRIEVLGETVEYRGVEVVGDVANGAGRVEGSSAVVADVRAAGRDLRPSLVAYPAIARVIAETSLVSRPWRDVQVSLRDAADDGGAVLQVGVHPLQVLVWWGALVLVAAGALAALDPVLTARRRRRTGPSDRTGHEPGGSAREPLPTPRPPHRRDGSARRRSA